MSWFSGTMILFTPWAKRSYDWRHLCWQNRSTMEIPWVVKTAALSADGRPVIFKYECKWQKRCGPFPKAQGTVAALDKNFLPAVSRAPLSLCRSLALSPPPPRLGSWWWFWKVNECPSCAPRSVHGRGLSALSCVLPGACAVASRDFLDKFPYL